MNDSHLQLNFPSWFLASAESCGKNVLTAMAVSWERGATCESLSWHRFRQSLSPGKKLSHPTRIVAGVGINWHTSAHKGSPLFRRRAPAPNTVDPRGLLTGRHGTSLPGVRRPLAIDGSISINGVATNAIRGGMAFSSRETVIGTRDAHTVAEGDVCWGVPRGAGGWPRRRKRPAWRGDSSASGRLAGGTLLARRTVLACRAVDRQRSLAVRIATA